MKFTAATFAALVSVATLAAAQDANEARDGESHPPLEGGREGEMVQHQRLGD
jgi:Spy/CpxP family protein refolding chaperone